MAGINKVALLGYLGKDPEVKELKGGKRVARVSLATSESYVDKSTGEKIEKTEWHNIVFWSPLSEIVAKYLQKGSRIHLDGKIETRSYEDKGVKKYITEIIAQSLTMLDFKKTTEEESKNNTINKDTDDLDF